jgi:hypothetical protein
MSSEIARNLSSVFPMTCPFRSTISRHLNPLVRRMSPSEACCSIPPVQAEYTPQATYKPRGALDRVYVTGGKSETAFIIV